MTGTSKRTGQNGARITALPHGLPGAAAVVVFGGSFDPVHRWHIAVARAARGRAGRGAWVVFVPAARSPLKDAGPGASDEDRIAMLRVATQRLARAAVWTDEIDRARNACVPGPSYSVDTLRRLRKRLAAGTQIYLLIGADQAAKFHLWHEFREVIRLAQPLVVLRPPVRSASALARTLRATGSWTEDEIDAWGDWIVRCPVNAVSSTRLRANLQRGRPAPGLPPSVARYIDARGLYRRDGAASVR